MGAISITQIISSLITMARETENPLQISDKLSRFISRTLRDKKIGLYEAYQLNGEKIRLQRLGYIQCAWNGRVRISICLDIMNQYLLARFFNDKQTVELLKKWGAEAFNLNNEKRTHYIMDRYKDYFTDTISQSLLEELYEIRLNCHLLSFDDGPYHNGSFPYDDYCPEKLLLDGKSEIDLTLRDDIVDLIVELNL